MGDVDSHGLAHFFTLLLVHGVNFLFGCLMLGITLLLVNRLLEIIGGFWEFLLLLR